MRRHCLLAGRTAAFFVLTAGAAAAQEASSFDKLRSSLAAGDKVIVTDTSGRQMHGRIADLSAASLTLMAHKARVELAQADIERISRRDSRWNGTLWGAAAGLVLGALFEKSLVKEYGREDIGTGTVAVPFTVIGAGIGFAVDALVKGERVLYARPHSSAASATLSAMSGPGRTGVVLSLRF